MSQSYNITTSTEWYESIQPGHRQLAQKLENECDWSWANHITTKDLLQYKIFLIAKVVANDTILQPGANRLILSPTSAIDTVWHQHMLRLIQYYEMNFILLGKADNDKLRILEHIPEGMNDSEDIKKVRLETTKKYMDAVCITPNITVESSLGKRSNDSINTNDQSSKRSCSNSSNNQITPNKVEEIQDKSFIIIARCHNKDDVNIKVSPNTKMMNIKRCLGKLYNRSPEGIRIHFDGSLLSSEATPSAMEMKDGDIIQIHLEMVGC
jgi:hypothetical protein